MRRAGLRLLGWACAALLLVTLAPVPADAAVRYRLEALTVRLDGTELTATATVRASRRTRASRFGVCVRDAAGRTRDLTLRPATLTTSGTRSRSASRRLEPGRYVLTGCLKVGSRWTRLGARTVVVAAPQPTGVPGEWRLGFGDDFDGRSLDTSRWTPGWFGSGVTQPVNAAEPQCYDARQVALPGDGTLTLTLAARTTTCGGQTRRYVSGLVSTRAKHAYAYGATEARIHLPADAAGRVLNWPAFWTNGDDWPTTGENDVMEGFGGRVGSHFHSAAGGPGFDVEGRWDGWHTYGSVWAPGVVTYYYDGREVGSITTGITSAPMYTVLNYAGSVVGDTVPARMQVDYVRVWQR